MVGPLSPPNKESIDKKKRYLLRKTTASQMHEEMIDTILCMRKNSCMLHPPEGTSSLLTGSNVAIKPHSTKWLATAKSVAAHRQSTNILACIEGSIHTLDISGS